jgi:release factor glutamine methyltransferase
METLGEALAFAVREFRAAGRPSPRLAAEVLLAHVLGWERSRVISHLEETIPEETGQRLHQLVKRHSLGEPLQYLTGEREFFGLAFRVSPAVLVPRQETEFLVEKAVDLARRRKAPPRFVDVGTGSGCIAIAFAREIAEARGWATDRSRNALELARDNARRLRVDQRVAFVCCDLLNAFSSQARFDFILSNPPYIPSHEIAGLEVTVRDYEPLLALDGGESGIEVIRKLIPEAAARLEPDGWLFMEIGVAQAQAVGRLLEDHGMELKEEIPDLQGIPRCLVARRRKN